MKKSPVLFIREFIPEAVTLVVIVAAVWFVMATGYMNDTETIQPILWGTMLIYLAFTALLAVTKKLTYERLVALIMLGGLIMRIGFILYKPTTAAYQDLGDLDTASRGHASYVLTIFETGALPTDNDWQFYHPPFFHILAACAMKVTGMVLNITDEVTLFESTKIISCAATCFTFWFSKKILEELDLGKIATVISLTVCAFLPIHYMLGGWINNDALVTFFMTWIILYTIRWFKNPCYLNIIMLAFGFGLGIFTKISCAQYAFFTGAFMLAKLIQGIRKKDWRRYIGQFAVFALIAFPIGLFYPIRNYILFGQSLNYVPVPGDNIYCGDHGFLERFVIFPIWRYLNPVYLEPFEEYNLNFYLIKSAAVGEFEYHHVEEWPAAVILVCNLILVVQAVFSCAAVCVRRWKARAVRPAGGLMPGKNEAVNDLFLRFGLPALWLGLYLFMVFFSIQLPYGCSMDFRYMVPTALIGSIYLGLNTEHYIKKKKLPGMIFSGIAVTALLLLSVCGMYMFSNMWKF